MSKKGLFSWLSGNRVVVHSEDEEKAEIHEVVKGADNSVGNNQFSATEKSQTVKPTGKKFVWSQGTAVAEQSTVNAVSNKVVVDNNEAVKLQNETVSEGDLDSSLRGNVD